MKIRPFLSHRRTNAAFVAAMRRELQIRGAGGWKDDEDLRLGAETSVALRDAIQNRTGGFLWYGTIPALESDVINTIEVPTALARAKRDPTYTVIPLFVSLRPSRDREALIQKLGRARAKALLDRNGLIRESSEHQLVFIRRVARRYVRDAILGLAGDHVSIMVSGFRASAGDHHLTLDWRSLLDAERRHISEKDLEMGLEALGDIRESLQYRADKPRVHLTLDLPLPLALLVGYEWRLTTRLHVKVVQPRGEQVELVDFESGSHWGCPKPARTTRRGTGPSVVGVGIGASLADAAGRYAAEARASSIAMYQVNGLIGAAEIVSIATAVTDELRRLNDRGVAKHLLIRGPHGLAAAIGMRMNGVGPTTVPFWDSQRYVNALVVGGPRSTVALHYPS